MTTGTLRLLLEAVVVLLLLLLEEGPLEEPGTIGVPVVEVRRLDLFLLLLEAVEVLAF
jgi:hypothetical protein